MSLNEEKEARVTHAERFQVFWKSYPRRVGKLAAQRSFERAKVSDELLEQMLTALAWQKEQDQWQRGFIPHPTTWLNQGRWLDEPDSKPLARSRPAPSPRQLEEAKGILRRWGGCQHEPKHDNWRDCVEAIVWSD